MAQKKKTLNSLPEDVAAVMADLESRKGFNDWEEAHPEHRLAFLFTDHEQGSAPFWQVGLFKDERMTTFTLGEQLSVAEDQEVYQTGSHLAELDLSGVKVGFGQAMSLAEERASRHQPFVTGQILAILQDFEGRVVWNITLVSGQYTFLNVKFDASSGDVVKEEFSPLFSMAKLVKGNRLPKAG